MVAMDGEHGEPDVQICIFIVDLRVPSDRSLVMLELSHGKVL